MAAHPWMGPGTEPALRAQQAIGAGDYVTYGKEMALVQQALQRLSALTGASPAP